MIDITQIDELDIVTTAPPILPPAGSIGIQGPVLSAVQARLADIARAGPAHLDPSAVVDESDEVGEPLVGLVIAIGLSLPFWFGLGWLMLR
jgi:hypothetical protein